MNKRMKTARAAVAGLSLLVPSVVPGAAAVAAAATIAPIARTGGAAPGTAAGTTFSQLTLPAINAAGQVAFRASLTGGGSTSANNTGIWTGTPGSLSVAARAGDAAPGTTSTFAFFDSSTWAPVISDSGAIAFSTEVSSGSFETRSGVWSGAPGSLALIARSAEPAPGTPYHFGTPMLPAMINAGGTVAFMDNVRNGAGGVHQGDMLFSGAPTGPWQPSGTPNTQAPGTPAGVNFNGITTPRLNDAGGVAFVAQLSGPGVVIDQNDQGVWSGAAGGGVQLVARMGAQAPDTPAGAVFGVNTSSDIAFDGLTTNANGKVAFQGRLADGGPGVTTSNRHGIWSNASGTGLALVAREGSQAEGDAAGVTYALIGVPMLDDDDRLAFGSTLSDGKEGIWTAAPSATPQLLVRSGDASPGISGAMFSSLGNFVMNDVGQIAFGGAVTPFQRGLWIADADGDIELLARTGQQVHVGDGVFKTVSEFLFHFGDGGDGLHASFNDAGQLAFFARFTDNSTGIFVAQVPEPSGAGVTIVIMAAAGSRRRRAAAGR